VVGRACTEGSASMARPNFLVIGAAKSGTTALCDMLSQHHDIYIPEHKEPHFFSFWEKGLDGSDIRRSPFRRVDRSIKSEESYLELFSRAKRASMLGEGSVSYLYWPSAADRIYSFDPAMKLIAILRHPVDRAYSSFNYLRGWGFEVSENFEEGLALEARRTEDFDFFLFRYLDMGFYGGQLERYLNLFPRDQLHIILYDDFQKAPAEVLRNIFAFLGVDENVKVKTNFRSNVTVVPNQNNLLHRFINSENVLRRVARQTLPLEIQRYLRYQIKKKLFRAPDKLDSVTRRNLTELYLEDIEQVQRLLGIDLSHWRN
jgi:hypothetical protein